MMRGKMERCRKRQSVLEKRQHKLMKRRHASKSHIGEKIVQARDIINKNLVQDNTDLVVTGGDVEGLYPSLPYIEVAIIVYKAVMNSGIRFENINFQTAGKYVAMHMTEGNREDLH